MKDGSAAGGNHDTPTVESSTGRQLLAEHRELFPATLDQGI
jgi:hypothetical protein